MPFPRHFKIHQKTRPLKITGITTWSKKTSEINIFTKLRVGNEVVNYMYVKIAFKIITLGLLKTSSYVGTENYYKL